jgi:hypothetical protein
MAKKNATKAGGSKNQALNTGGAIDPKAAPRKRNFKTELGAMTAAGQAIATAQADAAMRVNDRFQQSAQDSTRSIADNLNNDYTRAAQGNLASAQAGLDQVNAAQSGLGQLREQYAARGQDPAMSRMNEWAMAAEQDRLLRELETQAAQELALGRALTPEQERAATQAARSGMAARGLGTGNTAMATELLNRDAYASRREADRRGFASSVANQTLADRQANRAFLGSVAGMNFDQGQARTSMLSGLYGQQGGLGQTTASIGQGMAQSNVALDPYQRALGSNMPIATIGPSTGLIGQAYGQTLGYGQDLFNTNLNVQGSLYNTYNTNQAALQAARITGGATQAAGNAAMMGGMMSGLGSLAGGYFGSR